MNTLRLGKLPARPDAVTFKFKDFLSGTSVLRAPEAQAEFGHEEYTPPINWGMLGNDEYGDCVVAGGAHEHKLWARIGGKQIGFQRADVLRDFQTITGQPLSRSVGADVQTAASYRRRVGLLDSVGRRHKVAAYMALSPGNLQELYLAMQWFGLVGVGFQFPSTAMGQFTSHQSWHVVPGSYLTGEGHYVPLVAFRGGNLVAVSWGRFQAMRTSFLLQYMDEGIVYLSTEMLTGGKSPEGFDVAQLQARLRTLT